MTVNTLNITSGPYSGNDIADEFDYTFRVDTATQLIVYETDDTGIVTELTNITDYTVNSVGSDAGGTITRVAGALPTGYTWYIRANYQATQNTDFNSQGGFYPDVHEAAFDKLTFLQQQQSDQTNRSMRLPDSYSGVASVELPIPAPLQYFRWNEAGTALESANLIVPRGDYLFDNVADMISVSVSAGQLVETKGYTTAGDGGQGRYIVKTAAQAATDGDTIDEIGAGFTLTNGNVAVLQTVGSVNVKQFGAIAGVDSTDRIRKLHAYANSKRSRVTYAGIDSLSIQANADIEINTDVNFSGVELVLLNGFNSPPSYGTINTLFRVVDPTTPLVTVTGVVTGSLLEGSTTPTKGLFDGYGYAFLEAGLQIPARNNVDTVNYQQSFCVVRRGQVVQPLSTDLSAYQNDITVTYREMSKRDITIEGFNVTEGTWNNQYFMSIERNNVTLLNTTMNHTNGVSFDNICTVIRMVKVCNVRIDGFIGSGMPVTETIGSYVLEIDGGAEIRVNNFQSIWFGWSSTGNNHLNGFYITNSSVTRVDAHEGGHNIFVDNCTLDQRGVGYGWGGGVIKITNSHATESKIIETRTDHGGNFFGSIIVDNVTFNYQDTAGLLVASIGAGASIDTQLPKSIIIRNVHRLGRASGGGTQGTLRLDILKHAGVGGVSAPTLVEIDKWTSDVASYLDLNLDYGSMQHRPGTFRTTVSISDCLFERVPAFTNGIRTVTPTATPASPVSLYLLARGTDMLLFNFSNTEILRSAEISDCGICGLFVDKASSNQPLITLSDSRLIYAVVNGAGVAEIGGQSWGTDRRTIINNCYVSSDSFDLTGVSASSGVVFQTGAITPLIPAGATFDTMFTGYKLGFR